MTGTLRVLTMLAVATSSAAAQQLVDTAFAPTLRAAPMFAAGHGPVVAIDEAHQNFHTASSRYRPFASLLTTDGFVVRASAVRFDSASLASARVIVIANAVGARNSDQTAWRLPIASAFEPAEVAAVAQWVRRGGSLLLIADHLPFAGAAETLAASLGVFFANGFAIPPNDPDPRTGDYPIVFRRGAGLAAHPISDGRSSAERVDSVVSFTGSAFRLADDIGAQAALMRLPRGTRVRLPVQAWQFSDSTPAISGEGLLQGAAFRFGRGRVAVFGEAAMHTAQIKGAERVPMGMNAPVAIGNAQFVLNTLHWLVGALPDR